MCGRFWFFLWRAFEFVGVVDFCIYLVSLLDMLWLVDSKVA